MQVYSSVLLLATHLLTVTFSFTSVTSVRQTVTLFFTGTHSQTFFMQVTFCSSQTGAATQQRTVLVFGAQQESAHGSQQSLWKWPRRRSLTLGPQGTSLHS